MSKTEIDTTSIKYRSLLNENANVIDKILRNGVDPKKRFEFEFNAEFQDVTAARSAKAFFRENYRIPTGSIFMVSDHSGKSRLSLSVPINPDPEIVTDLETKMIRAAQSQGVRDVYWEFKEDPA